MAELVGFIPRPEVTARINKELKDRMPCERCGAKWCVHFNPEATYSK